MDIIKLLDQFEQQLNKLDETEIADDFNTQTGNYEPSIKNQLEKIAELQVLTLKLNIAYTRYIIEEIPTKINQIKNKTLVDKWISVIQDIEKAKTKARGKWELEPETIDPNLWKQVVEEFEANQKRKKETKKEK